MSIFVCAKASASTHTRFSSGKPIAMRLDSVAKVCFDIVAVKARKIGPLFLVPAYNGAKKLC